MPVEEWNTVCREHRPSVCAGLVRPVSELEAGGPGEHLPQTDNAVCSLARVVGGCAAAA